MKRRLMTSSMNGEGGPWQQTRTKRRVMITSVNQKQKKKANDGMFRV
jgi:hypothetical protein